MSTLHIRVAESTDASAIVEFNIAMARETEGKQLARDVVSAGVATLLESPQSGFYLVAVDGIIPVGCLMVTSEWSDWRNGFFWWIQSVYVQPGHRRQGVFRRLHERVKQLAEERPGVCGLRLYVEQDNTVAQQTYRALGMCQTSYRLYEQEFPLTIPGRPS